MCENIFAGFIANLIFLVFTILIGWAFFLFVRRRKLLKFFGVVNSKKLIIYLSNIRVVEGGSIGIDDKRKNYSGNTVTLGEANMAGLIGELFNYLIPGLRHQPGILKYLLVTDIQVYPTPSLLRIEDIDKSSSIVTFGSPGYNIVSEWIEQQLSPSIKFSNDNRNIHVDGLPDIADGRQAFVQRIYDADNRRMIFYTAGISALGTLGAIYFLVSELATIIQKIRRHFIV